MFETPKKKLIIVCDEKTKVYANFLRQLISANDDTEGGVVGVKDGTVEAAVWNDDEYLHNSATINSSEHVLFIGDNKVSKSEVSSMIPRFNQFGMKFGWLGKRGMMQVDDKLLNVEQYDGFYDYCMEYKEQLLLPEKPKKPSTSKAVAAVVASALILPPAAVGVGAYVALSAMRKHKELKDQQYRALTFIFYMEGLNEFLEG